MQARLEEAEAYEIRASLRIERSRDCCRMASGREGKKSSRKPPAHRRYKIARTQKLDKIQHM